MQSKCRVKISKCYIYEITILKKCLDLFIWMKVKPKLQTNPSSHVFLGTQLALNQGYFTSNTG